MDKKAIELSMNTIITLILIAIVLIFLTFVIKDKLGLIFR